MARQLCCRNPHLGLCHYALVAVVLWSCSNAKQGEVVYANYWLEFSQHKLTGQLKIHYADFSHFYKAYSYAY